MNGRMDQHWPQPVRQASRAVLDALLPPECLKCRVPVTEPGSLCADCFYELSFISNPLCESCGIPFETEAEAGSICGTCAATPPDYDVARAVFLYDDASKPLILKLKHADRTDVAPFLASWMARVGKDVLGSADQIFAVPLHRKRLFSRQFNQAALLARHLSKLTDVPFSPAGLIRTRDTGSQGGRSRTGRARNVAGAFELSPRLSVIGKSCVVVDDVLTTGATVNACARVLKSAGAERVSVLTVARVPLAAG